MARRILVSGASGLIGTELRTALAARGDQVIRLVRRPPSSADEIRWDPTAGHIDLDGVETGQSLKRVVTSISLLGLTTAASWSSCWGWSMVKERTPNSL